MWGVGFRFHVFTLLGGKKTPFQTKKTASTAETACPESTENFPILSPQRSAAGLVDPADLCWRLKRRGLEPG